MLTTRSDGESAFAIPAYRWYWTGGVLSDTGNWMQSATIPFVVLEVTHSPGWVGWAGFVQLGGQVLTTLPGGRLADRLDIRRVLFILNVLMGVTAALLAAYVGTGRPTVAVMLLLTGVMALLFGLTQPGWQSLSARLVPPSALRNASALTVAKFQVARALGPLLAGMALASLGPTLALWINVASFSAALVALLAIHDRVRPGVQTGQAATPSYAAVWRIGSVRTAVLLTCVLAFLGLPLIQFTAVLAHDIYHVGATAYGVLTSGFGWGSLSGALMIVTLRKYRRDMVLVMAFAGFGGALLVIGLFNWLPIGIVAVFCAGLGFAASTATLNGTIIERTPPHLRGRATSLYQLALRGASGVGVLIVGWMTLALPVTTVLAIAGALLFMAAIVLVLRRDWIGQL